MKRIAAVLPLLTAGLGFTACEDWFTIEPESEMIVEDFWKDGNDVKSAVGACYRALIEDGVMQRLIVWGELRSDNVIKGLESSTEVTYILEAALNESNSYARWGDFYKVINYCNTVIQRAPAVRDNDSNFSQAELDHYLAEVKTIRAFCYFTLVRTFGNVPFIVTPYVDDTEEFLVGATDGKEILNALLADLAALQPIDYYGDLNTTYNRGRVTQKAVWALMADIHLWLGNYSECVNYCNRILQTTSNPLKLTKTDRYFNTLYMLGNSDESIWELQFDNYNYNNAVNWFYGSNNQQGLLGAFDFDNSAGTPLFADDDLRGIDGYVENGGTRRIMKYVAARNTNDYTNLRLSNYSYGAGYSNWILYRLADAYLMKAEALTELGGDANLREAVAMVSETYDRAHPTLESGSLVQSYGTDQGALRDLVFDERQREFMFEGKRYFDLMRRMLRSGRTTEVFNSYLLRKYTAMSLDESTVKSKVNNINAIYMPIHEEELRLNNKLKQNPFYETSNDIAKN